MNGQACQWKNRDQRRRPGQNARREWRHRPVPRPQPAYTNAPRSSYGEPYHAETSLPQAVKARKPLVQEENAVPYRVPKKQKAIKGPMSEYPALPKRSWPPHTFNAKDRVDSRTYPSPHQVRQADVRDAKFREFHDQFMSAACEATTPRADHFTEHHEVTLFYCSRFDPHELSSFAHTPMKYRDQKFLWLEQAYQWSKAIWAERPDIAAKILRAESPLACKRYARDDLNQMPKVKRGWRQTGLCVQILDELMHVRYAQNERARHLLMQTGEKYLAESTGDSFWAATGVDTVYDRLGQYIGRDVPLSPPLGRNAHGIVLMRVREVLRSQRIEARRPNLDRCPWIPRRPHLTKGERKQAWIERKAKRAAKETAKSLPVEAAPAITEPERAEEEGCDPTDCTVVYEAAATGHQSPTAVPASPQGEEHTNGALKDITNTSGDAESLPFATPPESVEASSTEQEDGPPVQTAEQALEELEFCVEIAQRTPRPPRKRRSNEQLPCEQVNDENAPPVEAPNCSVSKTWAAPPRSKRPNILSRRSPGSKAKDSPSPVGSPTSDVLIAGCQLNVSQ